MNNFFKLIISVIVCEAVGFISSMAVSPQIDAWYQFLNKPFLNPPNWIFAPVWTILYFLMGVALFLVWKKQKITVPKRYKKAIHIFSIQLLLNGTWSIIFFGLQNPFWAFVNIVVLWIFILWTIISFRKISKTTFWLLLPYILWVTFASYLNLAILVLN